MVLAVVLMSIVASACSTSGTSQSRSPAALAAGGPWHGAFNTSVPPPPINSLRNVDCVTPVRCLAVGSAVGSGGAATPVVAITHDGGRAWSTEPIPTAIAFLSDVSCSIQNECAAVGQTTSAQGAVIVTRTGGSSWTEPTLPPGVLDVTTVMCRPDHQCLAVGTTGSSSVALVATSVGGPWTIAGSLPPQITGATDVTCVGATCWATGGAAVNSGNTTAGMALTTDGGATWSALTLPKGIGVLNGVSCLPERGQGSSAGPGSSTSSPPSPAGGTTSTAVPSSAGTPVGAPGFWCTAVGTTATGVNSIRSGNAILLTSGDGGAAWTSAGVPAGTAGLAGVSCPAVASCVTVGTMVVESAHGGVIILSGTPSHPWARPGVVPAAEPLSGVSCPSTTGCVIVGEAISEHLVDT